MTQIPPPWNTLSTGTGFVIFALWCPFLTQSGVSLSFSRSLIAIPILFLVGPALVAASLRRGRLAAGLSFVWAAVYAIAFVLTVISIPHAGNGIEIGVGWWQLGFGTILMVIGGWLWTNAPPTPG